MITSHKTGELQNIQTTYRLNGKNYFKWLQLVCTSLKGKRKLCYLLGMGPRRGDPRFDAWDEQDSTIITWLLNLLTLEISDTCMFLTTAKDI